MRVKLLRYIEYGRYFNCLLDESIQRNRDEYEIKIDDFEIGLAFFPNEDHYVTKEDYEYLVGREFDIQNLQIHTYRVKDKEQMKLVPSSEYKWIEHPEMCGRCGSEFCECKDFITIEDYNKEMEAERLKVEEEDRQYREHQDRQHLLNDLITQLGKVRQA